VNGLRCEVTGNPIGSDTWPADAPCRCASCRWVPILRLNAEREQAERPMTQAELAALPDGARIIVIWASGSGPFRYVLCRHNWRTYARTEREVLEGRIDRAKILNRVGLPPRTQVWRQRA
jgi:hypothetical protein